MHTSLADSAASWAMGEILQSGSIQTKNYGQLMHAKFFAAATTHQFDQSCDLTSFPSGQSGLKIVKDAATGKKKKD